MHEKRGDGNRAIFSDYKIHNLTTPVLLLGALGTFSSQFCWMNRLQDTLCWTITTTSRGSRDVIKLQLDGSFQSLLPVLSCPWLINSSFLSRSLKNPYLNSFPKKHNHPPPKVMSWRQSIAVYWRPLIQGHVLKEQHLQQSLGQYDNGDWMTRGAFSSPLWFVISVNGQRMGDEWMNEWVEVESIWRRRANTVVMHKCTGKVECQRIKDEEVLYRRPCRNSSSLNNNSPFCFGDQQTTLRPTKTNSLISQPSTGPLINSHWHQRTRTNEWIVEERGFSNLCFRCYVNFKDLWVDHKSMLQGRWRHTWVAVCVAANLFKWLQRRYT